MSTKRDKCIFITDISHHPYYFVIVPLFPSAHDVFGEKFVRSPDQTQQYQEVLNCACTISILTQQKLK